MGRKGAGMAMYAVSEIIWEWVCMWRPVLSISTIEEHTVAEAYHVKSWQVLMCPVMKGRWNGRFVMNLPKACAKGGSIVQRAVQVFEIGLPSGQKGK